MEDEVELLGGDAAVRGEVAGLEVAAAAHRKAQPIDGRAGGGAVFVRPIWLTSLPTVKAIPILTAGLQAADLDVDAVSELRPARRVSLLRHRAERAVRRDLPADFDVAHRHAAALERLGREPRPQHDAVGHGSPDATPSANG